MCPNKCVIREKRGYGRETNSLCEAKDIAARTKAAAKTKRDERRGGEILAPTADSFPPFPLTRQIYGSGPYGPIS